MNLRIVNCLVNRSCSWIIHEAIWCYHTAWDAHVAISLCWISIASSTLDAWCSAIIIIIACIWGRHHVNCIQISIISRCRLAVRISSLIVIILVLLPTGAIFPLIIINMSKVLGARNIGVSRKASALTLVAFSGLGLRMDSHSTNLLIQRVWLELRDEARLLLTSNWHHFVLLSWIE